MKTLTLTSKTDIPSGYEYLLAVSSDSLCVLDKKWEPVEWIIRQDDLRDVWVCEAPNEDSFLDCLREMQSLIFIGIDSRTVIQSMS